MRPVEFEPTISAGERPQTYALDRAATGTGCNTCVIYFYFDAGQLAISQYPEGPATGHLDTGFAWFPWVQERMLRWFPPFQVASTRFSCGPPDLNSLVTNCLLSYYVK